MNSIVIAIQIIFIYLVIGMLIIPNEDSPRLAIGTTNAVSNIAANAVSISSQNMETTYFIRDCTLDWPLVLVNHFIN